VLKEHDRSLRTLTAVARTGKIDVTIPSSLDEKHYGMIQRLRNLPFEEMDRGYVQEQTDAHQESMALLHDCSAHCRNPRLTAFAKDQEKMEGDHLAAARELARSVAKPQ
jgi:predicted outer membrane protein